MTRMIYIEKRGEGKRLQVRLTPPGYTSRIKISAYHEMDKTRRLVDRIKHLVAVKVAGDPTPLELINFLTNVEDRIASKLIECGLMDPRFRTLKTDFWDEKTPRTKAQIQQAREAMKKDEKLALPFIDGFFLAVANRRNNTEEHARRTALCVLRICKDLNINKPSHLIQDDIINKLSEWGINSNTKRHYLMAITGFAEWLRLQRVILKSPLEDVHMPYTEADTTFDRVPLTIEQFRALMTYMDKLIADTEALGTVERWPARDRKMVYWTAVCTAFRQNELRTLTASKLFLADKPPMVDIDASNAKNRSEASIPIPEELAAALRQYAENKHPDARIFKIPALRKYVIDDFKKDIAGAGLDKTPRAEKDRLDFHALRSTAITWWLDVYNLNPKRVQMLARLSSLHLVMRYSRRLKLEDFSWLDNAPSLSQNSPSASPSKTSSA
jgi:integrase